MVLKCNSTLYTRRNERRKTAQPANKYNDCIPSERAFVKQTFSECRPVQSQSSAYRCNVQRHQQNDLLQVTSESTTGIVCMAVTLLFYFRQELRRFLSSSVRPFRLSPKIVFPSADHRRMAINHEFTKLDTFASVFPLAIADNHTN